MLLSFGAPNECAGLLTSRSRAATPKGKNWNVTISSPCELRPAEVVRDFFYLGNRDHANNIDMLAKVGITHCVNVTRDGLQCYSETITYKMFHVADTADADISAFFKDAFNFIERAFSENGKVLVHCEGGISRSPAIASAYLMQRSRMPLANALAIIRIVHPAAQPNRGFIRQLQDLEKELGVVDGPQLAISDLTAAGNNTSPNSAQGDRLECQTPHGWRPNSTDAEASMRAPWAAEVSPRPSGAVQGLDRVPETEAAWWAAAPGTPSSRLARDLPPTPAQVARAADP